MFFSKNQIVKKYTTNISSNLKCLLETYSMNILELSKKTGISYSAIYKLVHSDASPNLDSLVKIAKTFNLNVSQLIGELPIFDENIPLTKFIPLIEWKDVSKFMETEDIIEVYEKNHVSITASTTISDKCFALKANDRTEPLFKPGTILSFDSINQDLTGYDNKFVLVSNNKLDPVIKKLYIEGGKFFLQSVTNNIPASELVNDKILAYLLQAKMDF